MIENYKRMIQSLEERRDGSEYGDQQMTDSQTVMLSDSLKAIKVEEPNQQEVCSLSDMLTDNFTYESDMLTESRTYQHIPQSEAVYSDTKEFSLALEPSTTDSSITTTAPRSMSISPNFSSVESSQSLQMVPQSFPTSASFSSSSLSPADFKTEISTKTTTYVTELGGSGCTVITNSTNFPSNTSSTFLEEACQGEKLEYTDLDKQEVFDSRYESIKTPLSFSNTRRAFHTQGSIESGLDDAVQYMQEIIQQDSDDLKIPFDPQSWTCEHVWRWVEWVCHKNELCDYPKQLACLNGQLLCSWSYEDFCSHCGQAGSYLYYELDLWKAANSCSPHVSKSPSQTVPCQTTCSPPNNFLSINNSLSFSPASSPSLSTSSSNSSSDSGNYLLSQRSDIAEEDNLFGSIVTSTTTTAIKSEASANDKSKLFRKRVPGRGHKKSIVLWQFLKKLLLSDQNYGCIRWIDRKAGIFKIEDSKRVATLWGAEKNLPNMNYDKLSRSVRQYYRKGIIKKPEHSKRLLYQFCPAYLG